MLRVWEMVGSSPAGLEPRSVGLLLESVCYVPRQTGTKPG